MRPKNKWVYVCKSAELDEREHRTIDFYYAGELHSGIVFRFKNKTYAYLNRCVHMPRRLNCERDSIFDDTGNYLRCSMHGIIYDPATGRSLSTMCNGEKLQALRVVEEDACIYINDKRVSIEAGGS